MSSKKQKPYEVIYNKLDPDHPSKPVMTSRIIYGGNLTAALVKFHNETLNVDIKKVEELTSKSELLRVKKMQEFYNKNKEVN